MTKLKYVALMQQKWVKCVSYSAKINLQHETKLGMNILPIISLYNNNTEY